MREGRVCKSIADIEEPVVKKLLELLQYSDDAPFASIIQVYAIGMIPSNSVICSLSSVSHSAV
jgi:hypothetical protein